MIQRNRGIALLTIATLVVALLITFPARVAYNWVASPFLQMSGIQGTAWSGSAREFSTNGVYLRDLSWRMRPLHLFTGNAVYAISGSPVSGFFEATAVVGFGGDFALEDLTASLPLQMFSRAAGIPGLAGGASIEMERLRLEAGRAVALDGTVTVSNLVIPSVVSAPLGGYKADFFTQNNGIMASVEDTDGVVDLAGSLQLNPDKTYSFQGVVVAKPATPDSLRRKMEPLLSAGTGGQKEIRVEGSY